MYAVVRLRGRVNVSRKIKNTLAMLRLHRKNHCVIVPDTPSFRGMLQIVKDYVAYGEINAETLAILLRKRGELSGGKPLTDEYVKEKTGLSIDEFAKAVVEGKASFKDLPDLKPVLRLHPPRKGLRNIKWQFQAGGELGYQGRQINNLLCKMR